MWGPDIPVVPPPVALRQLGIVLAGMVSFGVLAKYTLVADVPAVRREYPFSGLVTELGGIEENKVRLLEKTLFAFKTKNLWSLSTSGERRRREPGRRLMVAILRAIDDILHFRFCEQ